MKIKKGFVVRQIADQWMAVPIGSMVEKVQGLIALNETAAEIWKILQEDHTVQEVTDLLKKEYDVNTETLAEQVQNYVDELKKQDLIEE